MAGLPSSANRALGAARHVRGRHADQKAQKDMGRCLTARLVFGVGRLVRLLYACALYDTIVRRGIDDHQET